MTMTPTMKENRKAKKKRKIKYKRSSEQIIERLKSDFPKLKQHFLKLRKDWSNLNCKFIHYSHFFAENLINGLYKGYDKWKSLKETWIDE